MTMLSPAVPPAEPDYDTACRLLGNLMVYNSQLQEEMRRRAAQTNELHDAKLTLEQALEAVSGELEALRARRGLVTTED
jgi:hypothetical protein